MTTGAPAGAAPELTGTVLAATNVVPAAAELYRTGLGVLSWPLQPGLPAEPPRRVLLAQDPTDRLTLPVLWWTWRLGRTRTVIGDGPGACSG